MAWLRNLRYLLGTIITIPALLICFVIVLLLFVLYAAQALLKLLIYLIAYPGAYLLDMEDKLENK
jgi:type IV secretory pathway VirB3-like protein